MGDSIRFDSIRFEPQTFAFCFTKRSTLTILRMHLLMVRALKEIRKNHVQV